MVEYSERRIGNLAVYSLAPEAIDQKKPPILLVHGAWHAAWCWHGSFARFFADHGYYVHSLDLRGHGRSPAQTAMRWNRISHYVDDAETVVKSFKQSPIVIGHSMGGLVTQHLLKREVSLAGVGLLATVPTYGVWKTVLNIIRTRPIDFLKANLTLCLYPLVKDVAKARHMFLDDDTDRETSEKFQKQLSDESYLAFLDMLALDLPNPEKQAVPMMVVGGERDTIFGPETQQWTAERYGCECKIVPDAPHNLMMSKHWQVAANHFLNWLQVNDWQSAQVHQTLST